MGRQALRWLLGAGYVILVTLLLLYQMGVMGEMRNSVISVLGTLFLGIALAIVLVLYIRVTDRVKEQGQTGQKTSGKSGLAGGSSGTADWQAADWQAVERQAGEGTEDGQVYRQEYRSYEEIYADFLKAAQGCALSERELEVAWLLYRGYTNRQIGEELYIAETTVKKHVSHIYQKMEVCSRKEFRAMIRIKKSFLN